MAVGTASIKLGLIACLQLLFSSLTGMVPCFDDKSMNIDLKSMTRANTVEGLIKCQCKHPALILWVLPFLFCLLLVCCLMANCWQLQASPA